MAARAAAGSMVATDAVTDRRSRARAKATGTDRDTAAVIDPAAHGTDCQYRGVR